MRRLILISAIFLSASSLASAATIVSEIGPGKTYTTVSAWIAADYGGATATDTAIGQVSGEVLDIVTFDNNSAADIILEAASGQEHNGTPGTGAVIRANGAGTIIFVSNTMTTPVTIRGLEIDRNNRNDSAHCIVLRSNNGNVVERCLIYGMAIAKTNDFGAITTSNPGNFIEIKNNIILNLSNSLSGDIFGVRLLSVLPTEVYNNTVVAISNTDPAGVANGIQMLDDADHVYKNNLVQAVTAGGGGTAADYNLTSLSLAASSNNISQDATSPDTAYRSRSASFVNPTGDNYHLLESDTAARQQGVGPTVDAAVPPDDIDRDVRSGSISDVGADEVVVTVSDTKLIGPNQEYPDVTTWEADSYGVTPDKHAVGQIIGTVPDAALLNDTSAQSVTLESSPTARHTGILGTGSGIIVDSNSAAIEIRLGTLPSTFQWLEVDFDITRNDSGQGIYLPTGNSNATIRNNLLHSMSYARTSNRAAIITAGASTGNVIENNIVVDLACSNTGTVRGIRAAGNGSHQIYNNTIAAITTTHATGSAAGIDIIDNISVSMRNNLVQNVTATAGGSAVAYEESTLTNATSGYNISHDATSPDVAFRNQTAVFVNAAGGDYHLDASDTVARNQGIGPTADALVPLDDIDGDVRSGATEDIGADKYVAAISTIIPILQRHYLGRRQQ